MYKESLIFMGYSPDYNDWLSFINYLRENNILSELDIDLFISLYSLGYFTITKREINTHNDQALLKFVRYFGNMFMNFYRIDEDIMYELLLFDIYQDFDDNQVFLLKDEIINVIDDLYPLAKEYRNSLDIDQVRKEEILCIKEFLKDKKINNLLEVRKHYIEIEYSDDYS